MEQKSSGSSGSGFKFDFENLTEREISKIKKKRKPKISLAMFIMAVLVLIGDCVLVDVFIKRYARGVNDNQTVQYIMPQNTEIKTYSYHNAEKKEAHYIDKSVSTQPIIEHNSFKKDRTQPQIKQDSTQIYSWVDDKGVKHYSDIQPSGEVKKIEVSRGK